MSATSYYVKLLWINNQLEDYSIYKSKIPIYYDNKAAISLSENPTLHSRAKHIEIQHHFIRDHDQNGKFQVKAPFI